MNALQRTTLSSSWSLRMTLKGRRRVCLQTGSGAAGCLVQSYQPATGAAETVLLCHHWLCPVFIYNCLVWVSYQNRHQKTTTDSQDYWEEYWCSSTNLQDLYILRRKRAKKVTLDPSHPAHSPFEPWHMHSSVYGHLSFLYIIILLLLSFKMIVHSLHY